MYRRRIVTDDDLLAGFENATLAEFRHADHVRVGWIYVTRHGMPNAIDRFRRALQQFAVAKDRPTLYHETITWAYLLLIAERVARNPLPTWKDFAAANPDLLSWKPSLLERYYTPATLWSDFARAHFVMPDRAVIDA